jgi:hypothetical protein
MPEPEFEAYLSLLSKLLYLTSGQRAEITAELRDHLAERLPELQAQGLDRAQAIQVALDELGDAAALAVGFTQPHLTRRRRQLMRYSFGSVAVITATFLLASFYWPAQRHEPSMQVIAQAPAVPPAGASAGAPSAKPDAATKDELRQRVEEKLARRDVDVPFEDTPLAEAFAFLSDALDLDFVLDENALVELGIDTSKPVTFRLRTGSASVRTIIELLLRQHAGPEITYVIRDGLVMITEASEDYEIQVYDCRDLIAEVRVELPHNAGMMSGGAGGFAGGGGGGGFFSVPTSLPAAALTQIGGLGGENPSGGMPPGTGGGGYAPSTATSAAGGALIGVIQRATGPDPWSDTDGEGGTISEFDGLVVVRHSQRVHRKVDDLLAKLREAKQKSPQRAPQRATAPATFAPPTAPGGSPFGGGGDTLGGLRPKYTP